MEQRLLDAEILLSGHGKHKSRKKPCSIKSICSGRTGIYHPVKQVVNKIQKCLEQVLMNQDATGDVEIVFESRKVNALFISVCRQAGD